MREEGQEQAGELHGAMRKVARGSIGVGERRGRGSAVRGCSAAAMAWAAVFQGAGRGVGAWIGVQWRGEEREHGVAK